MTTMWIALSYSLPAKEGSTPRVSAWRRLRNLGSVALPGGVNVLPSSGDAIESFQWLAKELRHAGGEAVVLHLSQLDGLTESQLIDRFHQQCKPTYLDIMDQASEALSMLSQTSDASALSRASSTMEKLRAAFSDTRAIDYFESPTSKEAEAILSRLNDALSPTVSSGETIEPRSASDYAGRVWVTRPDPYVDRLACAWLIRRFIDPQAEIMYQAVPESGQVGFDFADAEFSHVGNLCTFETLLAAFSLEAPGLRQVAEVVHEIDLQDKRYFHPETSGVRLALDGWKRMGMPETVLERTTDGLLDGLLAGFAANVEMESNEGAE